jgi:dihydropteroate synthase
MKAREWKLARRNLAFGERTLVMGVLNVTPDSFSDGGLFNDPDDAIRHAERMVGEGADILDIGGESTRPGSSRVSCEEQIGRVVPIIESLAKRIPIPISIDTTDADVAHAALEAGAEIINDISALRFDARLVNEVARARAGLILMHSRGTHVTMHSLPAVPDIVNDVIQGLKSSIDEAESYGCERATIAVDPGIGFSKTLEQNLELLARLEVFTAVFHDLPLVIGTSRKSFIGRLLDDAPPAERLHGTMATVTAAVLHGAHIVRVHDVRAAVETVNIADAIIAASRQATGMRDEG